MFDTALTVAQTLSVAGLAAWLGTGVYDNLRHPGVNEAHTAEVLSMARMRRAYPDVFAVVAHRAITRRAAQLMAFRAVVAAELVVFAMLLAAVVALLMALWGTATLETARAIALIGAASFAAIWVGFLVVGNYFCYWLCHEGAQSTQYQMTLWGLAVAILLAAG